MTLFKSPVSRLSPAAAAIAFAATLVALFIACSLVAVVAPSFRVTHNWIALFTMAPVGSTQAWLQGIVSSAVAGALAVGRYSPFRIILLRSRRVELAVRQMPAQLVYAREIRPCIAVVGLDQLQAVSRPGPAVPQFPNPVRSLVAQSIHDSGIISH